MQNPAEALPSTSAGANAPIAPEERKRRRLEAWRRRQQEQKQQQPPPPPAPPKSKVKISLMTGKIKNNKKKKGAFQTIKKKSDPFSNSKVLKSKNEPTHNAFLEEGDGDDADDEGESDEVMFSSVTGRKKRPLDLLAMDDPLQPESTEDCGSGDSNSPNKRAKTGRNSRWDTAPKPTAATTATAASSAADVESAPAPTGEDALDQFMNKLQAGALGTVTVDTTVSSTRKVSSSSQSANKLEITATKRESISIHVGGSMMRPFHPKNNPAPGRQQQEQSHDEMSDVEIDAAATPLYNPEDWMSDATQGGEDSEAEEEARRALVEALKAAPAPNQQVASLTDGTGKPSPDDENDGVHRPAQLAAEVKSEKSRREEHLRQLDEAAVKARQASEAAAAPSLGRLYQEEEGGGVVEEAVFAANAAKAAPDALVVLAELNKKKELKSVDHSAIDYMPFTKNLYRVPRHLAALTNDEVVDRRAKLKVRVRGHGAPAPVETFEECGVSERILKVLEKQGINKPYPVQSQCIPCIMAGRDVIGIAKTGSGKTLAYLLPMLRHILVQPPLLQHVESGPIGLVLAPARELAFQIHAVCKGFTKHLGLKSTAVYGGAGVADQIADLKRGTHVVVATPGRLIDILTMQSGKILSLQRVTFVVMDEADRMYDMGFAPQISAIVEGAVRPDRQTVLFSATFPKAVESLARKSLKFPVEVLVGGRSVASDNVTQHAEVVVEHDKFLRLLQLLGEHMEGNNKVIVFVDTQVRADNLFEQLLRNGYPAVSLHGGKEQEDRDSTIQDFKRKDGVNVLVATGVAGRGLDVPACSCVINYSAPNHLEAYVHQVGRTGRASARGVSYTFVNPTEEAKHAPTIVRAMSEAGQKENVSTELKKLSDDFKAKVAKGEAKYAGSGFKGKGYTYDSTEMTEQQKFSQIEKRQALIEAGLLDPDDEDPLLAEMKNKNTQIEKPTTSSSTEQTKSKKDSNPQIEIPQNLTPELLALPGMKEALLRKAGIVSDKEDDANKAMDPSLGRPVQLGESHWLQELDINDYPREARWKVTQKETTTKLQDEFRTAVTLKGSYIAPGKTPNEGERRLYLHLEAASEVFLQNCVLEIQRLLNEETLRVGAKTGHASSHKYNVLG